MNFPSMGSPQQFQNAGMPPPGMGPQIGAGPRGLGGSRMPAMMGGRPPPGSLGAARAKFGPGPAGAQAPGAAMNQMNQMSGGVRPGMNMMGGPSVPMPMGPNHAAIQAEMERRRAGAQLGPGNRALAGYMIG